MIKPEVVFVKTQQMVADNSELMKMYQAMDRFYRNDWALPGKMAQKQWTYKAVDTGPHNALNTATKVLSAEVPRLSMLPAGPDPDDKAKANKIERGLLWELKKAERRARSRIVPDMVMSALRYDRVCVQIVHLPHHFESVGKSILAGGWDAKTTSDKLSDLDATRNSALRLGNYLLNVRNPQNVYSRHGVMGLESVVLVQTMRAQEIYDVWGGKAGFMVTPEGNWGDEEWTLYDYSDNKYRMVWAVRGDTTDVIADSSNIILHDVHGLPFIPWVDRSGGTVLDAEPEYQSKPFLESIYRSKSWEATNTIKTLIVSEVVKYAGAPRSKTKTTHGQGVEVEYSGDQARIDLAQGEEYDQLPPPPIDNALLQLWDRYKNELNAQTSVQVLADLNFPAGTAYATINAVLQTAIASLQTYKKLSEMALEDMFEIMLLWVDHTKFPIKSFGLSKGKEGRHYDITYKDFSVNSIYLEVELNAAAPTDRTEKINAGVMLYKNLPVAAEEVLSDIGFADPQKLMRDRTLEDFTNNEAELTIRQRQAEAEVQLQAQLLPMQLQMQQMQAQQQMQMQMMQQQMQAMQMQQAQMGQQGGPRGAGGPVTGPSGQPPGPEGAEAEFFANAQGQGQAYNQAQGGSSTQPLAPSATRETLSGADARGEAIAEAL